jgi:phosphatidylserine/phosphatidylglycerophosphate/cardiolipin synthase-like enzyme
VGTQALTKLLELLAGGMAERPPMEDLIDLVTTGPGDSETGCRDTSVVVRDLFHNAKNSVVVVGYAVHQGQRVFQALADRMVEAPGLQVRMYLDIQREPGDTSAPSEIAKHFVDRFRNHQWPSGKPLPQVFYDPRSLKLEFQSRAALHAKCIVVDGRSLFVSSANFTEAAQQKNIEVGLLLESPILADRLLRFFDALIESGHLQQVM